MKYTTLFLAIVSLPAWADPALPSGGSVVRGEATIQHSGNAMTINQGTDRAVINWNDFSVGTGNTVTFNQPSVNSATLNRVIGSSPSIINGQITANGNIFILNPNGISLGATGRIDAENTVLTTANISDDDFMASTIVYDTPPEGAAITVADGFQYSGIIEYNAETVQLVSENMPAENLPDEPVDYVEINLEIDPETQAYPTMENMGGEVGIYPIYAHYTMVNLPYVRTNTPIGTPVAVSVVPISGPGNNPGQAVSIRQPTSHYVTLHRPITRIEPTMSMPTIPAPNAALPIAPAPLIPLSDGMVTVRMRLANIDASGI